MYFQTLHRLGSKVGRLIMYPLKFPSDNDSPEGRLQIQARDRDGVKLMPIVVQKRESSGGTIHDPRGTSSSLLSIKASVTGSLSGTLIVWPVISPMAAPRSYWELRTQSRKLTTMITIIQLSVFELTISWIHKNAREKSYNIKIINYLRTIALLPFFIGPVVS
ncbi:nucleotide-diphospho-sugar transferase [Penicillium cf. griseofulvum]|uniref:Nucleotide-diphospho-sugar transferase n=1 Tax=Penicillium cf. griseofulvum TaxID=2972120 RepID=A0A9W9MTQ9_9EURO|nr:nucleotide-diphospho-sugar transferase [Penicillium cf. griseofulvum]KAJ5445957.1 nucleotide-diphospho-sugar transferase [Penicillium cf. griseofulvum]KAJ5447681.1 nucleotide-diphospho-sugar transferase [Penicillium cf. griseofulvum]